ncbi:unnamed protein product [Rhodiola kirilowii]
MLSHIKENGSCFALDGDIPKYKKRKIYAIRDFPHGCGPNAPRINVKPIYHSSVGHGDQKSTNGTGDELKLDNHNFVALEIRKCEDVEKANRRKDVSADSSGFDSSLPNVFSAPLQHDKPIFESNNTEKSIGHKYPPRRRISAVRDFPLLCGRDAPRQCHTDDECVSDLSLSNCSLLSHAKVENKDVKLNPSVKLSSLESGDGSQSVGDIRCKHRDLHAWNEGDKSKDECGSSDFRKLHDMSLPCCEDADKSSIEIPTEYIHPHRDHTSNVVMSETEDKDGSNVKLGEIDGDVRKEVWAYKEANLNSDKILENGVGVCDAEMLEADGVHSDGSGSKERHIKASDNSANRVIVQALMAGLSCKQTDVLSEDKRLRYEHSYSPKNAMDRVIVTALKAAPVSKETEHKSGDGYLKRKYSSKNTESSVVVHTLMAAPSCKQTEVHLEDKHFRNEHSYSPRNAVDRVIVTALKASTVSKETEHESGDRYFKRKYSSKNTESNVVVHTLMAAPSCNQMDVHLEDTHLRNEHSYSPTNPVDRVIVNDLNAAPVFKETEHESGDEYLKNKYSSKNIGSNVVVHALKAAPNCPWRKSKAVNPSSHNGIQASRLTLESSSSKQKSKNKKICMERSVLTDVSKTEKGRTNHIEATPLWSSYPSAKAVEGEGSDLYSWEQDEGCDDLYVNHITHDIDLLPVVPNNAKMPEDLNELISSNQVREVGKLMHEEETLSKRGATVYKHVDPVLPKIQDQEKYVKKGNQTLRPISGQPELAWNVIGKSKVCHGVCIQDISGGRELIPIRAVNNIDDQKPPSFEYITSMLYPDWCRPLPLRGCNCVGGCSSSANCACAVRNGGEIPFDTNGSIVEVKSLVYECGPSCKCPPSCPNRVSQFGIKFKLEIFKTEARGWGVRSMDYIPCGSFVCEYLGELLEDKQAEQRIDSDEYLFDIGSNFSDRILLNGLPNIMWHPQIGPSEVVDDIDFTIDAKRYGNVGRFINHSCSPNLYAQNVLYDHENRRVPHIMLFACENIPPFQELSYHYNYNIGEVYDANGNVKIKKCFCGSEECSGRLY